MKFKSYQIREFFYYPSFEFPKLILRTCDLLLKFVCHETWTIIYTNLTIHYIKPTWLLIYKINTKTQKEMVDNYLCHIPL